MPYFSIIVPAFNRERELRRALQSCRNQEFADFEVVVTDDGSIDGTAAVAQEFAQQDSRFALCRHSDNRGVCPARNSAIRRASGEWLVLLDSDMSLLPSGLGELAALTQGVPAEVGNVATRMQWDTGIVTPLPGVPDGILDYGRYVGWVNGLVISEYFNCVRAMVFQSLSFPESRAHEAAFHLALAKRWQFLAVDRICAVYHTDSPTRLCDPHDSALAKYRFCRYAYDHFTDACGILRDHGDVFRQLAPSLYSLYCYRAFLFGMAAGRRREAAPYWAKYIRMHPVSARGWGLGACGFLSARLLVSVYCGITHWRRARVRPAVK